MAKKKSGTVLRYNRWGYIFLIPFVVVFIIFQLIPLISTIYNSFFEHYFKNGLTEVGPTFIGIQNYATLFSSGDLPKYLGNTMIMWIIGFIPQILLSLLLGAWFSDPSLRLKHQQFFKTVIYLPNLIMASAFAMLFFTLFSDGGPINSLLMQMGILSEPYKFLSHAGSARSLVGFMNFLMWFGNTTILLLAGMLGIDTSLYEAAEVDGATSTQVFFRITLPLLRPILVYVMVTSLIGGLQMYDIPQLFNEGNPVVRVGGSDVNSTTTVVMLIKKYVSAGPTQDYGKAAAYSVMLFAFTLIISLLFYKLTSEKTEKQGK